MSKRHLILSLLLSAILLTACTGGGNNSGNAAPSDTPAPPPVTETPADKETPPDSEAPTDGETPSVSTPAGSPISAEAIEEYTNWFSEVDFNGLLRFPYSNGADSAQIAPYLGFLFYDMGETDISDEEYVLLDNAGMFLEVDEFRLPRAFVTEYLVTYLDMVREDAERMLQEADNSLGVYLPETDAWYICHGDTAWMPYTFDRGEYFPQSETVKLYYVNPFLTVRLPDGEIDFLTDQSMVVTILIEGGERRVLSNEIVS